MTNALFLVPLFTLLAGGAIGYFVGRYQAALVDKIRTLESKSNEPAPQKPTVLMGEYDVPPAISNTVDDRRPFGLVEPKTPEQVEWENKEALEKQALGR